MTSPARSEPLHDETYLPREGVGEIIDFLTTLRNRGRQAPELRALN